MGHKYRADSDNYSLLLAALQRRQRARHLYVYRTVSYKSLTEAPVLLCVTYLITYVLLPNTFFFLRMHTQEEFRLRQIHSLLFA